MSIKEAFERATKHQSKLTPEFISILTGLSSPKIWHLLNNLASESEHYLEVGVYMGSTLLAASNGNSCKLTAIDNFCMKPKTKGHFFQNMKGIKMDFHDDDAFKVAPDKIKDVDLYFFDGGHTYEDQYKAITHFLPSLKDEFIYVCDDWSNEEIRNATFDAIVESDLEIIEMEERISTIQKDKNGWWCGVLVAKLKKTS